jgi:hypothetical protein
MGNVINTNLSYTKPLIPLDLNKVEYIIVHHAEASVAPPELIHEWHLANGWSGAGYNEYIRKDGTVYIMRGDNVGAQCANMNSISYGIGLEGDYEKELTMGTAQMDSLVERLIYNYTRLPFVKSINPHKQFVDTLCPGKNFPFELMMSKFRQKLHWATESFRKMRRNGIIIKETRFDDKLTRGEYFVLKAQEIDKNGGVK